MAIALLAGADPLHAAPGCGPLRIHQDAPGQVIVQWPGACQLQEAASLNEPVLWQDVALSSPAMLNVGAGSRFFRTLSSVDGSCSLNIVGWVKVSLPARALIANPLNRTNNHLNTILPLPDEADGTQIERFNLGTQSLGQPIQWITGVGWVSADATETYTLAPGEGFFITPQGGTDHADFCGRSAARDSDQPVPLGLSYRSSIAPWSGPLGSVLGFPASPGDNVSVFNSGSQTYVTYTLMRSIWCGWPAEPAIPLGSGFRVERAAAAATWAQSLALSGCSSPPVFTRSPRDLVVPLGSNATLSVSVASAAP
jgi:hypothetical protein